MRLLLPWALWLCPLLVCGAPPERVKELEQGLDDDPARVLRLTSKPPANGADDWTQTVRQVLAAAQLDDANALQARIESTLHEAQRRDDRIATCLLKVAAFTYDRSAQPAEDAAKFLRELQLPAGDQRWCEARLAVAIGFAQSVDGRLSQSIASLQRAVSLAEADGDTTLAAVALAELAWIYKQARDGDAGVQAGIDAALAGLRYVDTERQRYLASTLQHNLAGIYLVVPRLPEAQLHAERAMALVSSIETKQGIPYIARLLGHIDLLRGRPEQALARFTESRTAFTAAGDDSMMLVAAIGQARAQLGLLRPTDARRTLNEIESTVAKQANPDCRVDFYEAATDVHAALGDARATARAAKAWAQAMRDRDAAEGRRAAAEMRERFDSERTAAENRQLKDRQDADLARERWLMLTLALTTLLCVGMVVHLVQQRRVRAQLHSLAHHDALTGLPNRRAILDVARVIAAGGRDRDHPACVALLDIDHFKRFNDSFGHEVGDRALQSFARACSGVLRSGDKLGRMGGEEFLLVMPETKMTEVAAIFERIRQALQTSAVAGAGPTDRLACSMGCAPLPKGGDVNDAVRRADAALYEAKALGRDRLQLAA